jgi:hypothetical protein
MNDVACAGHSSCRTPNDALHSFLSAAPPFELAISGALLDAGLQGFIVVVPASSPHSQRDRRYIQGSRLRLLTQEHVISRFCFMLFFNSAADTHSLASFRCSFIITLYDYPKALSLLHDSHAIRCWSSIATVPAQGASPQRRPLKLSPLTQTC